MREIDSSAGNFAELAEEMLENSGSGQAHSAEVIVRLAMDTLKCDFAGITIMSPDGRPRSLGVTEPLVQQADDLQYELRQGPCVQAAWDHDSFAVEDLASDKRWPRWGPQAAELGLRSILSVRLPSQQDAMGALNLYSHATRRFRGDDIEFAHLFARHAGAALALSHKIEALRVAIDSRTLIGQAQGILMERYGLAAGQAFVVLLRYSRDKNISTVAEDLVTHGDLPSPAVAGRPQEQASDLGGM